jgi:hypothetical protein
MLFRLSWLQIDIERELCCHLYASDDSAAWHNQGHIAKSGCEFPLAGEPGRPVSAVFGIKLCR